MKDAINILKKDPILNKILHLPVSVPYYDGDVNTYLYSSIISQQLSTKSADAIYNRFLNHFNGNSPNPENLLSTDFETLRNIGLSLSKAKYLHNVALFFQDNPAAHHDWHHKTDEQIITELTSIKGVGVWTVQMVLMFCLARKDVFPIGDLGVSQSIIDLYNLSGDPKQVKNSILKIAEGWKPFRSIASLYLWSWRNHK